MKLIVIFCVVFSIVHLGQAFIDKDVYQCLVDKSYSSFAQLLKESKLDTTLAGPGPFTLLAPSNSAVAAIDNNTMSVFGQNPALLKQVLQFHIINKYEVIPAMLSAGSLLTSLGQPVTASTTSTGVILNNASTVDSVNSDIVCNNGIIHGIESVMIPPLFSTLNLATVMLERDDIFKDYFLFLLLTELEPLIAVGEYTIFAPTDLAFGRFSTLNKITRETPNYRMIYYEVLKYHIVPGARYSYQLQDQQKLYTLHGAPITVTLPGQGVSVDGVANVVEANIPASNGVIHAIDHVLYPADLLQALINTTTPSPSG